MHGSGLIQLIASGASADVLRLGSGLVVKLFHAHVDPGVIAREHDGASRAIAEGLLVPRPVGRKTIDDRHGIIFEELQGTPLFSSASGWRIARARAALRKLAACHAVIHRCDAQGLPHHQHDMLRARIVAADADERLRQAALDQLDALPRGDRLCHGDFHPGNAVETRQGVAAVDWSNGCAGDPAGDVVRTELLLRFGHYGDLLRRSSIARWFRRRAADFYLRRYAEAGSLSREKLAAWRLPVAISCLGRTSRINRAALLASIAGRAID